MSWLTKRRDFLKTLALATPGVLLASGHLAWSQNTSKRREIFIGRRRVTVIDAHAHLNVAEVAGVVTGTPFEQLAVATGDGIIGPARIASMDQSGIDLELLTQQGSWWYAVQDRGLAQDIVAAQNEGMASVVAKYPDRFIGMTSMPLQFPEMAAETLERGMMRLGFKGAGISAGWVGARNLSDREYDIFWAKAEQLGAFLFMHPGGANGDGDPHFLGSGALPNTIGNPLETTIFLSRLLFEGTLDRFPGLKICGAQAQGICPRTWAAPTRSVCVLPTCAARRSGRSTTTSKRS